MFKKIYLDGPDLVGKTTLISRLNKLSDYKYYIGDRSWASCYVYNVLYRRNEDENELILRELNNLSDNERIIIITHSSVKEMERRYRERGDEMQTPESVMEINDLYLDLLNKIDDRKNDVLHFTTWEIMNMDDEKLVQKLLS